MDYTAEEIVRCWNSLQKPAVIEALRFIASGRAVVKLTKDRRDVMLDRLDGEPVRDDDHPDLMMEIAGAWPLYRAGMIDDTGGITDAGRAALAAAAATDAGKGK